MGNSFARPRPSQGTPPPRVFDAIPHGVPVIDAHSATAAAAVAPSPAAPAAAPPPSTTGAVAPVAGGDHNLSLSVTAEREALASTDEHTLLAMLSLKAPSPAEDDKRPPLDLVVAADRSGSMHGDKMRLMRTTLELLVKRSGLTERDRVSIVSFDSQVRLELPLEKMDAAGRAKAESVVRRIQPGSTTNLSGGALKAVDVLDASAGSRGLFGLGGGKNEEGRTRAVMLFTDGLANEGIRDTPSLCTAVNGALTAAAAKLGGPISLFTFGFGHDHNENCLRTLATSSGTGGLYYYVGTAEDIPNAFADALGGLTSVVAQNASVTLEALGGTSVVRVLGDAYTYANGSLALGDLFAEEEKDVLIELKLPALPAPAEAAAPVLRASLRAFNVIASAPEEVAAELTVVRPLATPTDQRVNTALDAQRNRLETAAAMEEAARLADAGRLDAGRQVLEAQKARVASSVSAEHALSTNLSAQTDELVANYRSVSAYRSVGSKMSKMNARSNQVQRAVHTSAPDHYAAGAKRKAAMKSAWFASSSLAGNGSDSD